MLHWMYDRFYLWCLRVFEGKWRGDKNASLSLHIELGILFLYNISIENSGGNFLSLLKIFVKNMLEPWTIDNIQVFPQLPKMDVFNKHI